MSYHLMIALLYAPRSSSIYEACSCLFLFDDIIFYCIALHCVALRSLSCFSLSISLPLPLALPLSPDLSVAVAVAISVAPPRLSH